MNATTDKESTKVPDALVPLKDMASDRSLIELPTTDSIDRPRRRHGEPALGHLSFFLGALMSTIASAYDLIEAIIYQKVSSSGDGSSTGGTGNNETSNQHNEDLSSTKEPWQVWSFYKAAWVTATGLYLISSILVARSLLREHRRWVLPLVFGTAAACDFISCFLDDEYQPWPSFLAESFSVHLFLISALLTLSYNAPYYKTSSSMLAILVGDCLFLMGAATDLSLSYRSNPRRSMIWIREAAWTLVSSVLWLVDSIVYYWADMDMFAAPETTLQIGGDEDYTPA